MNKIIFLTFLFLSGLVNAATESKKGRFSGRIVIVNPKTSLMRVKVDFENFKYVNKKDQIVFWDEIRPMFRCKGYVLGKTSEYMLIRIPNYSRCIERVTLAFGSKLLFFSQDLVNNLKMGREVLEILEKKRIALLGQHRKQKKELDAYNERVQAINDRYSVLREKLELEWKDQIANLEEDRLSSLHYYKDLERRIDEVKYKMEKYRVQSENLKLDRWSLDPRLYYKK